MIIARWPVRYDLVIPQGATFWIPFRLILEDGSLLDTGSFWAEAWIKANYDSPSPIIKLDILNGGIEVGFRGVAPNLYNLAILITSAQTAAMTDWGVGVWDLETIDSFGNTTRRFSGAAVLSREVSR